MWAEGNPTLPARQFGDNLSIVIPVYNEAATIETVISRVRSVAARSELIIVNDGSNERTSLLLQNLCTLPRIHLIEHSSNKGKGAALRSGFAIADSEIIVIQDADLEYNPLAYVELVRPIECDEADVVLGSRFHPDSGRTMSGITYLANRVITLLFNKATGLPLTDVETCYKAFRRDVLRTVLPQLTENRFGIEIELVARVAKLPGLRILEVPICYHERSRRDGKKIGFKDGLRAIWCILKYCRKHTELC